MCYTRNFVLSQIFLNEHFAAQDLMCWMEIEAFRGIPVGDRTIRDIKAKQLRSHYFNKKYYFGPNSPATKEQQRQVHIIVDDLGRGAFKPVHFVSQTYRLFRPEEVVMAVDYQLDLVHLFSVKHKNM